MDTHRGASQRFPFAAPVNLRRRRRSTRAGWRALPLTCVGAEVALECSVAGESPVAFTANVAANAGVDFHVLLQRRLRLETLPAEQAKDGHVGPCRAKDTM